MAIGYDLVIAGAGPVGLATAIRARLAGLTAIVVEARRNPQEKACGEGVMPRGRDQLRDMGVRLSPDAYSPFLGIRFVDGATAAEGRFSSGPGWGVRRTALWAAMSDRATELGATISLGDEVLAWKKSSTGVEVCTTQRRVSARILIGADGLHSSIRKSASLDMGLSRCRRFGMRQHYDCKPWSRFVEVHWADSAEAYVTPVGDSTVGVAILGPGDGQSYAKRLEQFGDLRARLNGANAVDSVRGAGPFFQKVKRRFGSGVALVGDAAGYVDPLTGEGLTLGFESARALIEILSRGRSLREYERAYRRLSRNHVLLTRGLLAIAARPGLRRRVVRGLARDPNLFDSFLAINAGEQPLADFGLGGAMRALLTVLG